jgi:3-oxoacyl-[acyl-carrier-protein] synthase-1
LDLEADVPPLSLKDFSIVTCLGAGRDATAAALRAGRSGLQPCTFDAVPFRTYAGEVAGLDDVSFGNETAGFDCRNHRIASMALRQDGFPASVAAARERYGAGRIGVFLGTSTSGMLQTEAAYRRRDSLTGELPPDFDYARTHNTYALASYVRTVLQLAGPAFVISTACAATAKVFASAARMIEAGICDAAIVGGADSLCATTLCGFHSLAAISDEPCRPFDADRRGISIGEAAGFVMLERADDRDREDTILLLGVGESSDAYHMSSPHPDGAGARLAMERALDAAGLRAADIDYINLHGTATAVGDAAEDRAVCDVFGTATPCSSTKGFAGHALGAAGVIDAIFCALGILNDFIPGSPHTRSVDPAFACHYMCEGRAARVDRVVSNSFGFGGANCSLVLGRAG